MSLQSFLSEKTPLLDYKRDLSYVSTVRHGREDIFVGLL